MTTENFCFYLQNRLIQAGQTGAQWYSDTSPLVFPGLDKEELSPQKDNRKVLRMGRLFFYLQILN
jgi:hypothetical protein